MPTVKWVDSADLYDNDGNYVHRTPVMTLDDLEAWLGNYFACDCSQCFNQHSVSCARKIAAPLLAQVQAMKEGR